MTLPNFLIIGAAKAGTTTLHARLRPHPEIFMPARKELRFFAYGGSGDDYSYPVKTLAEYESYFAEAGDAKAIGEATPRYLRTPKAAERIRALIPDCRLVVSLRNPVDQSFSSYLMGLRNGSVAPGTSYRAAIAAHPNFLRGYAGDLATYFGLFDRDRFHIIRFEDLVRDEGAVARGLYGFLGVATDFAPAVARVSNPGGLPKNRLLHRVLADKRMMDFGKRYLPERLLDAAKKVRDDNLEKQRMTAEERAAALAALRDDILRTGELVGQDLSAWLDPPAPAAAPPPPPAAAGQEAGQARD
jgi:hypothetical protein